MSESTPRAESAIIADLIEAKTALATATEGGDEAEITTAQEHLDGLNAERKAVRKSILDAQYADLQDRYKAATGAGQKAALRRHMNRIREKQGLDKLEAGNRSVTQSVLSADVLAMLEQDDVDDTIAE
jgi:hypothetical protein